MALYAGFYAIILAFLAVQFVYRLLTLVNISLTKNFKGVGIIGWIMYPIVSGGLYTLALYFGGDPDGYSDDYVRNEIFDVYELNIGDIGHVNLLPYEADNSFRWRNLSCILGMLFIVDFQYLIIIYCGIRMHYAMKKELKNMSTPNQRLQKQFFQALIVQTLVPTFLFVFPAIPLLTGPLLDVTWSVQSGGVLALLGIYPPADSIAFMLIVSEYRKLIKGFCWNRNLVSQQMSSIII